MQLKEKIKSQRGEGSSYRKDPTQEKRKKEEGRQRKNKWEVGNSLTNLKGQKETGGNKTGADKYKIKVGQHGPSI